MSITVQNIKDRIQNIENAISQSSARVSAGEADFKNLLANHHALLGMLSVAKEFLHDATAVANVIAPGNPATDVLNVVDHLTETDK